MLCAGPLLLHCLRPKCIWMTNEADKTVAFHVKIKCRPRFTVFENESCSMRYFHMAADIRAQKFIRAAMMRMGEMRKPSRDICRRQHSGNSYYCRQRIVSPPNNNEMKWLRRLLCRLLFQPFNDKDFFNVVVLTCIGLFWRSAYDISPLLGDWHGVFSVATESCWQLGSSHQLITSISAH